MGFLVLRDVGKVDLRHRAVSLRRQGFTYSEILKEVPVAKSTLSSWFHNVGLAEHHKQRITEKRLEGQKKAARAKRDKRIRIQGEIISTAQKQIGEISDRELWLIGISIYWAEGSKEKEWKPGTRVSFINMDVRMVQVFIKWLHFCEIKDEDISFDVYVHETRKSDVGRMVTFWSEATGFSVDHFPRIYFKKAKLSTKRRNTGDAYNGILKISVRQSSSFLRIISGWTNGVIEGINKR